MTLCFSNKHRSNTGPHTPCKNNNILLSYIHTASASETFITTSPHNKMEKTNIEKKLFKIKNAYSHGKLTNEHIEIDKRKYVYVYNTSRLIAVGLIVVD